MRIIVDGFGGDNSPGEVVKGVLLALYKHKDLNIELVGKEEELNQLLQGKAFDAARLHITNASEVISCDEAPIEAVRAKKDSSIVVGLELLKTGEYDGMVSAGSTGAVLGGAVLKLGRQKGVSRPALSPLLPTIKGGHVLLIDCGANMDSKPINLCHFALMGNEFMKVMFGLENPRVALLSVGVEDAKGNELVKSTLPLLKKLPINFVGNMEARDALSGEYDVIVTDGFAGNVLLKSTEGTLSAFKKVLKKAIYSSLRGKLGGMFLKKPLAKTMKEFDYESMGGSPLLGTKQLVIKGHGSSKASSILAAIEQCMSYAEQGLLQKIADAVAKTDAEALIAENGAESTDKAEKETVQSE